MRYDKYNRPAEHRDQVIFDPFKHHAPTLERPTFRVRRNGIFFELLAHELTEDEVKAFPPAIQEAALHAWKEQNTLNAVARAMSEHNKD